MKARRLKAKVEAAVVLNLDSKKSSQRIVFGVDLEAKCFMVSVSTTNKKCAKFSSTHLGTILA